jgi:cysteine desulfurase/selenocysteine lyase
MTDAAAFRSQFPVLTERVYLNAGTEGPMPQAAADAVREQTELAISRGRADRGYFEVVLDLASRARAAYATVLGADPSEIALTGSTTDGVNSVLGGLSFAPGDEIVTCWHRCAVCATSPASPSRSRPSRGWPRPLPSAPS